MSESAVIALCIVFGVLYVLVAIAAYYNGVVDGYGYAVEPNCPGYAAAGEYLRKHMSHRWSGLEKKPVSDEAIAWESMMDGRAAILGMATVSGNQELADRIQKTECSVTDTKMPIRRHAGCANGGCWHVVGRVAYAHVPTTGCLVVCDACGSTRIERML